MKALGTQMHCRDLVLEDKIWNRVVISFSDHLKISFQPQQIDSFKNNKCMPWKYFLKPIATMIKG